jgi:F-type H+-transporting ATPase subunit epsilon
MPGLFSLEIVSPEKVVYKGEVFSLSVPAELGYLGVLAHHAPLIAYLVRGEISFVDNANKNFTYNSKSYGFLEVLKNRATIILDSTPVQGATI